MEARHSPGTTGPTEQARKHLIARLNKTRAQFSQVVDDIIDKQKHYLHNQELQTYHSKLISQEIERQLDKLALLAGSVAQIPKEFEDLDEQLASIPSAPFEPVKFYPPAKGSCHVVHDPALEKTQVPDFLIIQNPRLTLPAKDPKKPTGQTTCFPQSHPRDPPSPPLLDFRLFPALPLAVTSTTGLLRDTLEPPVDPFPPRLRLLLHGLSLDYQHSK